MRFSILAPSADDSAKRGRTNSVQSGQIAGVAEPLRAARTPAMNVPCRQARLSALVQPAFALPGKARMFFVDRSA